jgi:hypothetical protein
MTNSTFWRACTSPSSFFRRSSLLEGRTKQRRLAKPHSRSFSTTFEPIKPLDPVTRMQSFGGAMDVPFIMLQSGRQASDADRPALRPSLTGATNKFTLRNDLKIAGRLQNTCEWVWVGVWLIIECPCAAPPNIKRALICASVAARNVCSPIGRTGGIGCYSRYVYSIYPAGRTIGERSNPNSSSLDST